jgi:hypothetical protein
MGGTDCEWKGRVREEKQNENKGKLKKEGRRGFIAEVESVCLGGSFKIPLCLT